MQNISEQKLLVLLLVIQSDLDNRNELGEFGHGLDQSDNRIIDIRAISRNLVGARPGD